MPKYTTDQIRNLAFIGGGGTGRNTAIVRSNYLTPEGVRFYQGSARTVVARARSGERVSLPLSALRGFVAADGLQSEWI